ncbi:MAG TPA: ABC transporter permease subunit [Gryllotalpicola sp.]
MTVAQRQPHTRTHLPQHEPEPDETPSPERRVALGASRDEVFRVLGAAVAGLAVGLLFTAVIGLVPIGWLLVLSFAWFVAFYTLLVFLHESGPAVVDRFWTVMLWAGVVAVVGTLALVIIFIVVRGWSVYAQLFTGGGDFLHHFHFFTEDMGGVGPLAGLDVGGILHGLVGTLVQIGIALVLTVPLGLTTAVFLGEVGGRFARIVRTIVEAMTALPSVVAGLFIYASVIVLITKNYSGLAASLAITVLMLPIMIRSSDVVLRLVPGVLREGAYALGAGQWRVVWFVVLPTVRSGLVTAIILATAHGIGETAPVLLTAGFTPYLNANPLHGAMVSLPLLALNLIESPQPDQIARGFATALALLVLVLILFGLARALGGGEAGKVSDRQLRRLRVRSRHTLTRIGLAATTGAHPSALNPLDQKEPLE